MYHRPQPFFPFRRGPEMSVGKQINHKPTKEQLTRYESEQRPRTVPCRDEYRKKAEAMDAVIYLVKSWDKSKSKFLSEGDALVNAIKIIVESLE